MADSHLTYIHAGSSPLNGEHARYDVYPREGGAQLGVVIRYATGWFAWQGNGDAGGRAGRTRWEAATALWMAPAKPSLRDPSGDLSAPNIATDGTRSA